MLSRLSLSLSLSSSLRRPVFAAPPLHALSFRGLSTSVPPPTHGPPRPPNPTLHPKLVLITATGLDRNGIVSETTKIVSDNGGNVSESRAVKLGGHFSLMMLVSAPKSTLFAMTSQLTSIGAIPGVLVNAYEAPATASLPYSNLSYAGIVRLEGADQPGIIYAVTKILASHGLSIDRMTTAQEDAPFGGTTLFFMEGLVTKGPGTMPGVLNSSTLREELCTLGKSMNCDIDLVDLKPRNDAEDKALQEEVVEAQQKKPSRAGVDPNKLNL